MKRRFVFAVPAALGILLLSFAWRAEWVHAAEIGLMLWLRSLAAPLLTDIVVALTALGNPSAMAATIVLVGLLSSALRGHITGAVRLAAATLLAFVLSEGIKWLVERPRPDVVMHLAEAHGYSFPSGHATVAFALWGGLAWRLWWNRHLGLCTRVAARGRTVAAFLCGLLAVAITLTRPYLGVHWPTDSLAGALLGIGSAALVDVAMRRRGEEEV